MRPVRSALHLVAQRDALLRLINQDRAYESILTAWGRALGPAEAEALRTYDTMVRAYIRTMPAPERPKHSVH